MKTKTKYSRLILLAFSLLLTACGTKKNIVRSTTTTSNTTVTTSKATGNSELQKLAFMQKVADNAV